MFDFLKKKKRPVYTDSDREYLRRQPPRQENDDRPDDDVMIRDWHRQMKEDASSIRKQKAKSFLGDMTHAGKVAVGAKKPATKKTTVKKKPVTKKKPATKRKAAPKRKASAKKLYNSWL